MKGEPMDKRQATEFLGYLLRDKNIERTIYEDALKIAIESLKAQLSQEGTTKGTTSDLISRQWLMECVNEGWIKFDTEKDENRFIHLVRDIAPGVQSVATDTNVGDTISRQAAIDATKDWYEGLICGSVNGLIKKLKALPPVQPETAKRIVGKSRDGMTLWYQCDMCNEPVDEQDNYCRGCGRRLIDG